MAKVLKSAGYATGIVGKWGLGEPDTTGVPNRQGFDDWFGYLNQHHAHNYYPDYLWRNEQKVPLANVVPTTWPRNGSSTRPICSPAKRSDFSIVTSANDSSCICRSRCRMPTTRRRRQGMEVPSDAPYSNESWPQPQKNHAAMITYLDAQVGKVLAKLGELGLDDNTIVFFTSDNGPHREGGADPAFFHSAGPLRGLKRALYEGGIRVPMIVRFPGRISAGTTSSQVWAFWDVLPTLAELAGANVPQGLDGISMVPALLGSAAAGTQASGPSLFVLGVPRARVRPGRADGQLEGRATGRRRGDRAVRSGHRSGRAARCCRGSSGAAGTD